MRTSRLLLSTFLLWCCTSVFAQTWCPPGATWWFGFDYGSVNGYRMYSYSGDTIVHGRQAKRVDVEVHWHTVSPPSDAVFMNDPIFTSMDNGVLYQYLVNAEPLATDWDTLIWYGASPGDQWQVPQMDDYYCDRRIVVTDTGHVEVAGLNLRYVQTDFPDEYGEVQFSPLFLERIGSVYGTFLVQCGFENQYEPDTILRCYQDVELSYSVPNAPPCDFVAGIGPEPGREAVALWPNPGTDMLHIGGKGKMEVRVLDAAGRAVLAGSSPNGSLGLSSAGLSSGVYLVEVSTATKRQTVKWIKR
ncbi:MAG: T9SS type A sorting domain-containing protein [Bacteroidetes bacterium]|nr:T9SS type A sorting domain-containing protein [Bacteroidota bacterium]MBS1939968.1 T9SS type A sorting domain-containing protein [Bacteroidota bacterium]